MSRTLPILLSAAALLASGTGARAADQNGGAGALVGTVAYAAPGVPLGNTGCRATQFNLTGMLPSVALMFNTIGQAFAGQVTITGTGASDCENAVAGGGTLTLTVSGDGRTGGALRCLDMPGRFARLGTDVQITLTGSCSVDGFSTGSVTFFSRAEMAPDSAGPGVTVPLRSAALDGTFAMSPA